MKWKVEIINCVLQFQSLVLLKRNGTFSLNEHTLATINKLLTKIIGLKIA